MVETPIKLYVFMHLCIGQRLGVLPSGPSEAKDIQCILTMQLLY